MRSQISIAIMIMMQYMSSTYSDCRLSKDKSMEKNLWHIYYI